MEGPLAENMTVNDVKQLVTELETASQLTKRGKASKVLCTLKYSGIKVNSWRFNEWDYGKNNISMPCNARGLFIIDDPEKPEIVARGYDKFFNVEEIAATAWKELERTTEGPYEVSLKENGCIIFIAGRPDGELVVCSKHSTGPRDDTDRNHAEAGEQFLRKLLEEAGASVETLARELYAMNCTAVAEYCDDAFEEHIIPYARDRAGLYLHGLNKNTREFQTLPMPEVKSFAEKYHLKIVDYFVKPDIETLRSFLQQCSIKGSYNDQEVEGFVIRCRKRDGHAFLFKYKFEEPYLLYRQWREATKDYINSRMRTYNFKKHRFITNKYLDFVIPLLDQDPDLCKEYIQGKGIIKLRKMFLEDFGMSGLDIMNSKTIKELEEQYASELDKVDENTKFIFIPVATVGCGKTTVALALKNIFGESWGHIQNDNIVTKDKSKLMRDALEFLQKDTSRAVIVDRNNHMPFERKQLFEWLEKMKENYIPYNSAVKVVCLSFLTYKDVESVREITKSRVAERGDNHQSIKALSEPEKAIMILDGFLKRFRAVNDQRSPDNMFDKIIQLKVLEENSSLTNIRTILEELHASYPTLVPELPSDSVIEESFKNTLSYKPTFTKIIKSSPRNTKYKPTYWGAELSDPKLFINQVSDLIVRKRPEYLRGVLDIVEEAMIQKSFHVTLIHCSAKRGNKEEKDMWAEYNKRYANHLVKPEKAPCQPPKYIETTDFIKFSIDKLLWDDKIMTATVSTDKLIYDSTGEAVPILRLLNTYAHITVGTRKAGVQAVYSNELCRRFHEKHGEEEGSFSEGMNCIRFPEPVQVVAAVRINIY
ncbi:AFR099Cp [Eremothecium gossypii ATCC 10895]|uniref:tRNA ligase n=1 Tax=Eremothecium gossypii (strain ATCC 10895 / CBS 109.51 / FGSC 9923 / NRRL Y-1056) TaxID=284811 RepID=Q754H3_EREGS|nr:AFR099Cp [Eremothecium gossypii ATCC 10895]AAS53470.2 AFR099Cp [Eremothecium gossypii ATCC 10895]AEY97782.1 FAFR099Cp [Eremothecium gossypii FDAG1]